MPRLSQPRPPLRGIIAAALQGAFLLARGRPEGMAGFETTPEGAARSFWAALFCLPGFIGLRLLSWSVAGGPPGGLGRGLAAELIGYACTWAAFVLVTQPLVAGFGKAELWPRFIAAWNWCNVIQYAVLALLTLVAASGVPGWLANGLTVAAMGYVLWFEWFITRAALRVGGGIATLVVVLELAIGFFLAGMVARLSLG